MPRRRVDDKKKWKLRENILALSYNKTDPFKEWILLTGRPEKAEGKEIICACQYTGLQKYYEVRNDLGGRIYVGEGCIKYFPDYVDRKKKYNIAKKKIHGILNMKRGQYTDMDIFEYRNLITSQVKNFLANINIKELYSIKNPLNLGNYEFNSISDCKEHYEKIQKDIKHIEQKIPIINNAINDFVKHLQDLVDDIQCRKNIMSDLIICQNDMISYSISLKEDTIVLRNIINKKRFTNVAETVANIARERASRKEKEMRKKARRFKELIERVIIRKFFWRWYEKFEKEIANNIIKRIKEKEEKRIKEAAEAKRKREVLELEEKLRNDYLQKEREKEAKKRKAENEARKRRLAEEREKDLAARRELKEKERKKMEKQNRDEKEYYRVMDIKQICNETREELMLRKREARNTPEFRASNSKRISKLFNQNDY